MPESVEELLQPILGANPAGGDLRYSATYEKIKEARREDDGLSQGAWQRERKLADYRQVIELTQEALRAKSKDLQLAAWLTEALIQEEGFPGLHSGLAVCLALVEKFWETMYPVLEDGDAEMRAAPLEWIGTRLDATVRAVPLVKAGYDWFAYKESRALGYENSSATPEQKKAREKALKEGKLSAEAFDKAFGETPRVGFAQSEKSLDASLQTLQALNECCNQKFGDGAPAFGKLRAAIEEVRYTVHALLEKKRELEPEPVPTEQPKAAAQPVAGAANVDVPHISTARTDVGHLAEANTALKAGRQELAFQILNRDLATQSCGRSRFMHKLQLARLCIATGKDLIAQPLLDDLAATIDAHKLDEWEEHETVAAALVTILQSSKRIQGDAKEKQKVFERICRLDVSQALAC
jgi:type VI secretion system protein ImpA